MSSDFTDQDFTLLSEILSKFAIPKQFDAALAELPPVWIVDWHPGLGGGGSVSARLTLEFAESLRMQLLDGLSVQVGEEFSGAALRATWGSGVLKVEFEEFAAVLTYDSDEVRPTSAMGEPISGPVRVQLVFSGYADSTLSIGVTEFAASFLTPVAFGGTGIWAEIGALSPVSDSAGKFIGLKVGDCAVHFPLAFSDVLPPKISLKGTTLTKSGLSGSLDLTFAPTWDAASAKYVGPGGGTLGGFSFGVKALGFAVVDNAISKGQIAGELRIPPLSLACSILISMTSAGVVGVMSSTEPQPTIELPGIAKVDVSSLVIRVSNECTSATAGGKIRLSALDGVLDLPAIAGLFTVDSHGNVTVVGDWLNFDKAIFCKFAGFDLQVRRFGMGRGGTNGGWIGLSGEIRLAEGMPAGASVDGLRVSWRNKPNSNIPDIGTLSIAFEGIGVKFTVPGVFSFDGHVAYKKRTETSNGVSTDFHEFRGGIKVKLLSLNVTVDGQVVFGTANGTPYMAVYLDTELPSGIPLFSTGLSLYGFSGLTALNMAPNKLPGLPWYKPPTDGADWYHASPVGVAQLSKWTYTSGAFALGAGVTIGTATDNGRTFSGKFLLVIMVPGPVILLEGQANLMKPRADLGTKEPDFRALAVLDVPGGIVQFGLDAKYAYQSDGSVIKVSGSVEAMFHLGSASDWYINVGKKDPMASRVQALIISLFTAKSYLMISPHGIATGCWVGLKKDWNYKIVSVKLEASLDANVSISLMPPQFHGDITLQGAVEVRVFGVGIGISAHCGLTADVAEPFKVAGQLQASVKLPWPVGKWNKSMSVSWTKPKDLAKPAAKPKVDPATAPPPLALPVKEVAIGHRKSDATWLLARDGVADFVKSKASLFPNYAGKDGYRIAEESAPGSADALVVTPEVAARFRVVPMDSRIEVTFARPVGDAHEGGPVTAASGWTVETEVEDVIGAPPSDDPGAKKSANSPVTNSSTLRDLEISVWAPVKDGKAGSWVPHGSSAGAKTLSAYWVPPRQDVPAGGGGKYQTKLWINADSAFDMTIPLLKPGFDKSDLDTGTDGSDIAEERQGRDSHEQRGRPLEPSGRDLENDLRNRPHTALFWLGSNHGWHLGSDSGDPANARRGDDGTAPSDSLTVTHGARVNGPADGQRPGRGTDVPRSGRAQRNGRGSARSESENPETPLTWSPKIVEWQDDTGAVWRSVLFGRVVLTWRQDGRPSVQFSIISADEWPCNAAKPVGLTEMGIVAFPEAVPDMPWEISIVVGANSNGGVNLVVAGEQVMVATTATGKKVALKPSQGDAAVLWGTNQPNVIAVAMAATNPVTLYAVEVLSTGPQFAGGTP